MTEIYVEISKLSDKFRTMCYGITQDKEDIDFITNVIIASLTEEEVAKHIPEEGQRLLRKKLVSLMDKKLGL